MIQCVGSAETMGGSKRCEGGGASFGVDERVNRAKGELELRGRSFGGTSMILVEITRARFTTMVLG
jgi:hypothetical protein